MIDVIIPAYNAHNTIINTLRSLAIQRLAKELCVLIINDGSEKDYSKEISYFKNDFKYIKEITLKENHGVGYCRQLALEKTKNPHIFFIDSDDLMVNPYTFNYFLKEAEDNPNYAVIYGNVALEGVPNDNIKDIKNFNNTTSVYTCSKGNRLFLHGKLYNRKFLEHHNCSFIKLRSNEDLGFNAQVFTLASEGNVIHLPIVAVTTICNNKSITRNPNSTRKYLSNSVIEIYDGYEAMLHALNVVKTSPLKIDINVNSCKNFIHKYLSFYLRYCHSIFESEEQKRLFELICAKYYEDIVLPILKNTKYPYKLPNKWGINDYCFYIEATKDFPHPEINEWSQNILSNFSQQEFDKLCKKYLTKEGYICQHIKK